VEAATAIVDGPVAARRSRVRWEALGLDDIACVFSIADRVPSTAPRDPPDTPELRLVVGLLADAVRFVWFERGLSDVDSRQCARRLAGLPGLLLSPRPRCDSAIATCPRE